MTVPLEDYALIGDRQTAALVSRFGSIDWLCWPRFDSDACFASLIGGPENGRWVIAPAQAHSATRRYQTDTMVLETDFETDSGTVRLIDFMVPEQEASTLVRILVGVRGSVALKLRLDLRYDYGKIPPWTEPSERGFIACIGPDLITCQSAVTLELAHGGASAAITISEGERLSFLLRNGHSCAPPPGAVDADAALLQTQQYWRAWINRFDKPTRWPDAVRRSLLVLRASTHWPTGGLVAAPTTSLPEQPGGSANWDYRYCWLRNSTFTISALLNAGYHQEAREWRDWVLRALAGTPSELRILYRVDGARHVNEWTVDWLRGYRWSKPVRIGNAAASQRQIDVLGEVLETMALADKAGVSVSEQEAHIARALVERIETMWPDPGEGVWEGRGEPRNYTYSKVMAWAGVDRFLRHPALHRTAGPDVLRRLAAVRESIHREVCEEGFHSGLGRFVDYYGGETLDASLLLMPLVGFLPVSDPRMAATIAAVERTLMHDGLVRRKPVESMQPEGAFIACTCWLADCRNLQGRDEAAVEALERVLSIRNDVGLLSEDTIFAAAICQAIFPRR